MDSAAHKHQGGLPKLSKLHVTCNMSQYTPNPQGFNVVPEVWANTASTKKANDSFPLYSAHIPCIELFSAKISLFHPTFLTAYGILKPQGNFRECMKSIYQPQGRCSYTNHA